MKNTRRLLVLFTLAFSCLCAGCGSPAKKHAHAAAAQQQARQAQQQPHRLVGTIVAVNEQQGFVLIDTESTYPAAVGTALKSFNNGTETGVLTVSPEEKAPYMIADIVSGTPQKGDQVFE